MTSHRAHTPLHVVDKGASHSYRSGLEQGWPLRLPDPLTTR